MTPKKKKARIRRFLRRRILIILIILLQIAMLLYITVSRSLISRTASVLFTIISFFAVLFVLSRKTENGFKIAWIFWILLFPVFGGIFYALLHAQRSGRKNAKNAWEDGKKIHPLLSLPESALEAFELETHTDHRKEAVYLSKYAGFPAYKNNKAEYFSSGAQMHRALLSALQEAKRYIFLEFFIIEEGKMWGDILAILEEKAKAGVLVRVMYDDLGSLLKLPKKYASFLAKKGIECRAFSPLHSVLSLEQNNRDHRKIVSIDGVTAFTGGVNLADEYIGLEKPFGEWKDAAVRIDGAAAWSFTVMFLQMWETVAKKKEDFASYLPSCFPSDIEDGGITIPYADRPTDNEAVSEELYMDMITSAEKYVYITTPYLILDDRMASALAHAAKCGVDVRIITPKHWDKKLVHAVTRSYYADLIESGVKIYEYTPGFIHSKNFVSDDKIASVGTANLDYRSLYLHFECGAMFWKGQMPEEVKKDFLETLENCERIALNKEKNGFFGRIKDAFLSLLAPLF